jgi:UDP-N-acetylglucosamine--N-acetylmuramyl-(pentapeptide) pyrophosphoryl-undecaprenol N-acetylglucosamine transferase
MGGSQGASALNERVPEAVGAIAARASVEVLHQAGRDREGSVVEAYRRHGVTRATVVPFIDDVATAIAGADIVIARAGAGTIAEIAAIGRACILVPFPHAADDHQHRNAAALARAGAAVCLPQALADVRRLAAEIARLTDDGEARAAMARAARAHGRPNAARDVADDLLGLAGIPARALAKTGMTNGAIAGARH